ncbi:MAG: Hsp20/alpha crystallin family protein [Candidatus Hodarchaeales archaeon]
MSLMKRDRTWEPFQEIARLENEMRNLFSDIFGDRDLSYNERVFAPLVDLKETENEYIIEADIPGFKKEDITIEVTPESVELSAEHKEEKQEEEKGKYLRRERCAYRFFRQIPLPGPVDIEKIKSSYKNGTITLELTKKPDTNRKRITL